MASRFRSPSFRGALCAGLLVLGAGAAFADDPRDNAVDQDMARLQKAMMSQDATTMVDMMYEPIVQIGGGRDKMLDQAKALLANAQFTSFSSSKPYQYFSGQQNDYVAVPTHIVLTLGSHHFDSVSYELGIKSHQSQTWQYVDGAGMSPQLRGQLFPDIPADVVLPEHTTKQID